MFYSSTRNVYKYDRRNLIISYSIALSFTLLCLCVGFFALKFNGVIHSTAFSAIIATTRNIELDELLSGHSLGAMPLKHPNASLRFGELAKEGEKGWSGASGESRHIGFGESENILSLRKGQKYI